MNVLNGNSLRQRPNAGNSTFRDVPQANWNGKCCRSVSKQLFLPFRLNAHLVCRHQGKKISFMNFYWYFIVYDLLSYCFNCCCYIFFLINNIYFFLKMTSHSFEGQCGKINAIYVRLLRLMHLKQFYVNTINFKIILIFISLIYPKALYAQMCKYTYVCILPFN